MSSKLRVDPAPLIHALFDAVGDDARFADAVRALGAPLGAVGVHGFLIRKSDGVSLRTFAAHNTSGPEMFDDYERRWRATDPRFATSLRCPDRLHSDVDIVDPTEFERSGLYNENLKLSGIRYTLFGSFAIAPDRILPLAFMRPKAANAFDREDIAWLDASMPSLARAVRLHDLVDSLAKENRDLRAVLDRMPAAVAIVGADGRVRATNAAATKILSREDGLCTRRGVLSTTRSREGAKLSAALAQALRDAKPSARQNDSVPGAAVRIDREHGSPLEVLFLPFGGDSMCGPSEQVMAVIYDPDDAITIDEQHLTDLYGLTATEAEIAASLANGMTIETIADSRRCTSETVRTHLKRVLSKTGQSRQAHLVRLVLSCPATLRRR